jgi:hypothetical protein
MRLSKVQTNIAGACKSSKRPVLRQLPYRQLPWNGQLLLFCNPAASRRYALVSTFPVELQTKNGTTLQAGNIPARDSRQVI